MCITTKVVAVATPVITAPLGNRGAPVTLYQQFYQDLILDIILESFLLIYVILRWTVRHTS